MGLRETPQREMLAEGQPQKRGIWPALGLFFLAPLVAEFLLGDLPIKLLPALIVLAPAYGGGALLIREMVRRTGRGWPSIVLLGMAYAIFAEAFTTQSLFNPNYLKLNLGLLTPAFIPWLGISAWWTLWMFMVHAIWSISTPIALAEACVPDRARTPWLGRKGLVIVALLFLLGVVASTAIGFKQDRYMASPRQFAGAAVVVVALAVLAFVIAPRRRYSANGQAPSPWLVGTVALVFASVALFIPKDWGWGAVAVLLGLDAAMLLLVIGWSRKGDWGLKHQLALGAGAAFAYGWHAFFQHPVVGNPDPTVRIGNAVFLTGAILLVWFAAQRDAAKPEHAL